MNGLGKDCLPIDKGQTNFKLLDWSNRRDILFIIEGASLCFHLLAAVLAAFGLFGVLLCVRRTESLVLLGGLDVGFAVRFVGCRNRQEWCRCC